MEIRPTLEHLQGCTARTCMYTNRRTGEGWPPVIRSMRNRPCVILTARLWQKRPVLLLDRKDHVVVELLPALRTDVGFLQVCSCPTALPVFRESTYVFSRNMFG